MKNKRKTLRRKQMGGEIKKYENGEYDGDIIELKNNSRVAKYNLENMIFLKKR